MNRQLIAGSALILAAVAMMLVNVSDALLDLQNWHSATTPQFVGAALKQVGAVILSAVGGTLLPQLGASKGA